MSTGFVARVVYPESDGKPMAESGEQRRAIVTLGENIAAAAGCCVGMDNFVYPVEGDPTVVQAPDIYVALGRPPGPRPSYRVWEEGGVFPQVVIEVLSPSNTKREMHAKRKFYFEYGAEEYYEYDPYTGDWDGFYRPDPTGPVQTILDMDGHTSPRLGIRFAVRPGELLVFHATGERFKSFSELRAEKAAAEAALTEARIDAAAERVAAREAKARAAEIEARALAQKAADAAEIAALKAKLHAAGLNGN